MDWLSLTPRRPKPPTAARLELMRLEPRETPTATASLAAGVLTITGGSEINRVTIILDASATNLIVKDGGILLGTFSAASVTQIQADLGGGPDTIHIAPNVTQPATLMGGAGHDLLFAGGGPTTLDGGTGNRSEEHTSELQSHSFISYAVF